MLIAPVCRVGLAGRAGSGPPHIRVGLSGVSRHTMNIYSCGRITTHGKEGNLMDPDVSVEVEGNDETPAVVEDAPDVVVVDTGSDSGNDLDIGVALGALTATVNTIAETVNALS